MAWSQRPAQLFARDSSSPETTKGLPLAAVSTLNTDTRTIRHKCSNCTLAWLCNVTCNCFRVQRSASIRQWQYFCSRKCHLQFISWQIEHIEQGERSQELQLAHQFELIAESIRASASTAVSPVSKRSPATQQARHSAPLNGWRRDVHRFSHAKCRCA